jgi:hypothetical protein
MIISSLRVHSLEKFFKESIRMNMIAPSRRVRNTAFVFAATVLASVLAYSAGTDIVKQSGDVPLTTKFKMAAVLITAVGAATWGYIQFRQPHVPRSQKSLIDPVIRHYCADTVKEVGLTIGELGGKLFTRLPHPVRRVIQLASGNNSPENG